MHDTWEPITDVFSSTSLQTVQRTDICTPFGTFSMVFASLAELSRGLPKENLRGE